MSVKLREKQMKNGQLSLYLDIYHNKSRWYEFLDIHINKNKVTAEDKEKRRLALEIRAKKEHQLITNAFDLESRPLFENCLVKYFELYYQRNSNGNNLIVLNHLKKYTKGLRLPFGKITADWLKDFEGYFLKNNISNNTTIHYMRYLNGVLNKAVKDNLLRTNPYFDIPKSQRLKKQDIFRASYTLEQLQQLANTPCKIEKQIKQAYFFSCFTGLRWSDVNPLRWDEIIIREIDGKTNYYVHFEQEKTDSIDYLPLSDNAIDIIEERKKEAQTEVPSDYVFPRIKDKEGKYYVYKKVKRGLKKWGIAAGLSKIKFHSGRHSFATNVLENCDDGDLYTVSKLLGHKSIQSTQVYAKVRDKRKLAAVKALPKINLMIG